MGPVVICLGHFRNTDQCPLKQAVLFPPFFFFSFFQFRFIIIQCTSPGITTIEFKTKDTNLKYNKSCYLKKKKKEHERTQTLENIHEY